MNRNRPEWLRHSLEQLDQKLKIHDAAPNEAHFAISLATRSLLFDVATHVTLHGLPDRDVYTVIEDAFKKAISAVPEITGENDMSPAQVIRLRYKEFLSLFEMHPFPSTSA